MTPEERYQEYFAKKDLNREIASGGVEDLSGPIGEGVAKTDWLGNSNLTQNDTTSNMPAAGSPTQKGAMGAASAAASGGNLADIAGAGLMASGNPYAMGAGLGLQTLNQINKSKQQREQNQYLAEIQKLQARQEAINKLAQIGQNLKA